MAKDKQKVVCVLYADPVDGYPPKYARDDIPKLPRYPDGQTMPSPEGIDFRPGELLGCTSGELGLRKFIEDRGHTLVVTSDKDRRKGSSSVVAQAVVAAALARPSSSGSTAAAAQRAAARRLPRATFE